MDYIRDLGSRYRMPDFSKLWRASEDGEADGRKEEGGPGLAVRLEAWVVQFQELGLWTEPSRSAAALAAVHAVYLYLSVTASTTLNLACWTALVAFVYSTWVNRIWPEIRVPIPEDERPDSESFTPMHPDCLSGPEVQRKLAAVRQRTRAAAAAVKRLREESPAKFCAAASAFFLALACVGSRVTALGLAYFVAVGSLVLPGVARLLLQYPAVQCFAETVFGAGASGDEADSVETAETLRPLEAKKSSPAAATPKTEEESGGGATYFTNFQSGLAETLNQGSAYLSSVTEAAATAVSSAAASATSAPAAATAANVGHRGIDPPLVGQCCRHSDSEEDMKEYLPRETEETDQILEAEAAGAGGGSRRRRKSGSMGKESEGDEDEEDQLHSLISGLERPPSVEDMEDKEGGATAAVDLRSDLEPEEEEFLPTVTVEEEGVERERRLTPESPKRRDSAESSSSTSDKMSLLRREVDRASSTGASKLDASESASEQEEDFELISDEELRSATNEDDDNDDGDNSK